jgi:hypothetical protein
MSKFPPTSPLRTQLNAMIQALANPDLDTAQGRLDYRMLLLTQNAADLLDLPDLAEPEALSLFAILDTRLRNLVGHELLEPSQVDELMAEVTTVYAKFRPELLDRMPRLWDEALDGPGRTPPMPEYTRNLDTTKFAALATFGSRFNAFCDQTDPLLAIVEAANLKGRLDVLQQLDVIVPADAHKARQMLDLLLASILDTYLDVRYDTVPVRGVVASLRNHVEGF